MTPLMPLAFRPVVARFCSDALLSVCLLVVLGFTAGPASADQLCQADKAIIDIGCTGCSTTISMDCDSLPGDCEGCTWLLSASLTCGVEITTWFGGADIECGDKFSHRFGGCGSGGPWGLASCECGDCP